MIWVKIGRRWYRPKPGRPVMVELTADDRKAIAAMPEGQERYLLASYDERDSAPSANEVARFMECDPGVPKSDATLALWRAHWLCSPPFTASAASTAGTAASGDPGGPLAPPGPAPTPRG